jgi:hypothetical protein
MADQDDDKRPASAPRKLRELFPEFAPPSEDVLRVHLEEGLVILDTNALFAAYRLNASARREFLRTLRLFGARLWIPHRVAQEFLEGRLDVIEECEKATVDLNRSLKRSFDQVVEEIKHFGTRRGLSREQVADLRKIVTSAQEKLRTETEAAFTFDLKKKDSENEDPILIEVEDILSGKIGEPLEDMEAARMEARHRFAYKVPPGYMDASKEPDRAIGDFLIWTQLIRKTASCHLPALLVTNDEKEDWVTKQKGPRPELVAEMRSKTGQGFHLVNVRTFLNLANKYMDARVSEETITQAQDTAVARGDMPSSPAERRIELRIREGRVESAKRGYDEAFEWLASTRHRLKMTSKEDPDYDALIKQADVVEEVARAANEEFLTAVADLEVFQAAIERDGPH